MSSSCYLAQIDARFLSRTQDIPFLTEHVTSTGVFVRTDTPPQTMDLQRIEFTLPPHAAKIVLHGMVTKVHRPEGAGEAPGVEVSFFAKEGDAGYFWDEFIKYVGEKHPESLTKPVVLAKSGKDQIRRAHPRLVPETPIKAQATGDGDKRSFDVGNISAGGMFIRSDDAFLAGAELHVTLQNPNTQETMDVECIVRRRVFGTNAGAGVEFRNVNYAQRNFIRELLVCAGGSDVTAEYREVSTLPGHVSSPRLIAGKGKMGAVDAAWAAGGGKR